MASALKLTQVLERTKQGPSHGPQDYHGTLSCILYPSSMCVIKASYLHLVHSVDMGMQSRVMHFVTNQLVTSKKVQNHASIASTVMRMRDHEKPMIIKVRLHTTCHPHNHTACRQNMTLHVFPLGTYTRSSREPTCMTHDRIR